MFLEFHERMIMVEEWWSSMLKGDCVWVTCTLSTSVCISTQGSRRNGGKEHDRSGAGEEGYAALCAGCEGNERNEVTQITILYCVKSG